MTSNWFYVRFGKRWFDVTFSAVALVVFAPLWIIAAALVFVRLGSPVLLREERLGLGGRTVRLLSFRRTKSGRAEHALCLLGRMLQWTGLHALPRLWNVLRGDLSLVGPVPPSIRHGFRRASKRRALTVRPGLFVFDAHAAVIPRSTSEVETAGDRYAARCSFAFDLGIMLRSLRGAGTDTHVEENKTGSAAVESPIEAMETQAIALASAADLMSRFGTMRVLSIDQETEWHEILRAASKSDFYHLPSYHRLAHEQGEGKPLLFTYREGTTVAALPLLLRPLDALPWAAKDPLPKWDATSVYGYAGPIASEGAFEPAFAGRFRRALTDALRSHGVISVFSRLDPMLNQLPLLQGLGQTPKVGTTVSIDVTQSDEQLLAAMHRTHRKDVNALRRQGFRFRVDDSFRDLERFAQVYDENMQRVNAAPHYQFPIDYFRTLCRAEDRVALLLIEHGDALACGGLILQTGDLIQYHLCGTGLRFLPASPAKLLIFAACGWARERGAKTLHLGGGLGGNEDSLFRFKRRFGGATHPFHVWRWIVDAERYRRCCDLRSQHDRQVRLADGSAHFFPAYRAPVRAHR
jgi:lipopolysaccharide/colanic/teichoic acid biosynthesis glycosyltransferase